MRVVSYGLSDIGRKRKNNEDNYLIDHDLHLYIIADGMGGHLGGEQASKLAVTVIGDTLRGLAASPDETVPTGAAGLSEPARFLIHAVRKAGSMIHQKSLNDPQLKGMGTTTTALWIRDSKAVFAHVGDSRGYLIRDGAIQQVTEDHSWVREQVKAGLLSPEDAKLHSYKNIITRSVGFEEDVKIDTYVRDIKPGDVFVLCTDGLSNLVRDPEILSTVAASRPKEACQNLVTAANEKGGDDNVTVIIAAVEE